MLARFLPLSAGLAALLCAFSGAMADGRTLYSEERFPKELTIHVKSANISMKTMSPQVLVPQIICEGPCDNVVTMRDTDSDTLVIQQGSSQGGGWLSTGAESNKHMCFVIVIPPGVLEIPRIGIRMQSGMIELHDVPNLQVWAQKATLKLARVGALTASIMNAEVEVELGANEHHSNLAFIFGNVTYTFSGNDKCQGPLSSSMKCGICSVNFEGVDPSCLKHNIGFAGWQSAKLNSYSFLGNSQFVTEGVSPARG